MKEYAVPFKLEGHFIVRSKNISDLKKKMDGMDTNELIKTAANIRITADPDKAEKIAEYSDKIKIKTIK